MKPQKPTLTPQDAERLARDLYGLTATVHELPSYRDQNFRLTTPDGIRYALKIANADMPYEMLDMQVQALAHLAAHTPALPVPRIVPTLEGSPLTRIPTGKKRGRAQHWLWLITYLPGKMLADTIPNSPALLRNLGEFIAKLEHALAGFAHPAAHHNMPWVFQHAGQAAAGLPHLDTPAQKALVQRALARYEQHARPRLPRLRTSAIHNDANQHNLFVSADGQRITGLIDFGDMVYSQTINELAIAGGYAMLDKADPLTAAAHLVAGYNAVQPLTDDEIAALLPLMALRICISVTMSAKFKKQDPDNAYLAVNETPAFDLLKKLDGIPPALGHYILRAACARPPCPQTENIVRWLHANAGSFAPVIQPGASPPLVLDLSAGSPLLGHPAELADTRILTEHLFAHLRAAGADVGIGRYNEPRLVYTTDAFLAPGENAPEHRTIHLGVDLFAKAGMPVFAPLAGTVHSFQNNAARLDYGPTIILQHDTEAGTFYTLYGHLSADSLDGLAEGMPIAQGAEIARIGDYPVNGDWPPHLHFQAITDLLGRKGEFPGVAPPSQRAAWLSLSPNPAPLLGLPAEAVTPPETPPGELRAARAASLGKALSISYRKPLHIVRGAGQYLYDETGQPYLDCVNNVCHVGHSHPHVVRALAAQAAVLNTNTRYLHKSIVRYAERLTATLPDPLQVCFFVNSGSEANDLALRMARAHTASADIVVIDGAYHGNLSTLIDISPYKFAGPGGAGAPEHVHVVPMPDVYRGPYRADDPQAGARYARHVAEAVQRVRAQGRGVAAFIGESLLGCGGQIALPEGYLREAYRHMRAAGGVCIADEVQVGFGRVGTHFWGFELQGVVPDIVTMGKPMGNGHPLAAVVTTREIAESFANGMEYFNTFGGNPVSCAVGLAVLDVIEDENLQANAEMVGGYLLEGLRRLASRHAIIGDVRGAGLFAGVEFVLDRETREPAPKQASYIIERMRAHGILLSIDGPLHNVLKIKPPIVFTQANTDTLIDVLDKVLLEDSVQI